MKNCDLRGADLTGLNLKWAVFNGAILDETTKLSPKWRRVWKLANAGGVRADLRRADLPGADLRQARLQVADLTGAHLQSASLMGAHLFRARLRRADLPGTYLQYVDLQRADLRGADLRAPTHLTPCCGARSTMPRPAGPPGSIRGGMGRS